ncbi:hypothetical protein VTO42DRAFT_3754 [Malbranchea cinnamomea]
MSSEAHPSACTPSLAPIEISFLMPKSIFTNVHIHLTFLATSAVVFLTTTAVGESVGTVRPMGSFVYGMPDRTNPANTLCTVLYSVPSTIDYATRMARILARRMQMPVYVGCSVDFSGSTVEEETAGLTKIVETILSKWEEFK